MGLDIQESTTILKPLNYDAYHVDEIYGYNPKDNYVEVELNYRNIESKEIESFKEFTEPVGPMDSAWPMYCHDVRHTGRSPYSTADNVRFEKWNLDSTHTVSGAIVIDKDENIYFGSNGLYAVYPNGTLKWKYITHAKLKGAPAIDENGIIYCYGLEEEKVLSKVKFGKDGDYEDIAIMKNTAYVLKSNGHIYRVKNFKEDEIKEALLEF